MSWQVRWTNRALKEADALDEQTRTRVLNAIERYSDTERGDIRRLQGNERAWRLRVGAWRVKLTFDKASNTMIILRVLPVGAHIGAEAAGTYSGGLEMTTKERLHSLVDELAESMLPEAERLLEDLRSGEDPLWKAFMEAPEDDEPLTPEDIAAIEEADAEIARGELVPWEEVKSRLPKVGEQ